MFSTHFLRSPLRCLFFAVVVISSTVFSQSWGQDSSESTPTATTSPLPKGSASSASSARDQMFRDLAARVLVMEQYGDALGQVAELARPCVVHIEVDKRPPQRTAVDSHISSDPQSYAEEYVEEAGSGTVIRIGSRLYVLTNRHVLQFAEIDGIRIRLANGRKLHAVRKMTDRDTDIAILELSEQDCVAARLGNSDDVHVGDFVLAFGSPFGLSHSVTHGIISAKGRRDLILGDEDVRIQDFMQTDAAINPGNSGGPLLNLRGEVIGINTAIASNSGGNEGIGFSIPINMATHVARQLVENGTLIRGYLGVQLDGEFDSDFAQRIGLRQYTGTRVSAVTSGSPAEEAGIRSGDVVLQFDDQTVEDDSHLVNLVGLEDANANVPLRIFRDGIEIELTVSLRPRTERR